MSTIQTQLFYRRKGQRAISMVTLQREANKPANSDTIDGDIMLQRELSRISDHWHFVALCKPLI